MPDLLWLGLFMLAVGSSVQIAPSRRRVAMRAAS